MNRLHSSGTQAVLHNPPTIHVECAVANPLFRDMNFEDIPINCKYPPLSENLQTVLTKGPPVVI